MIEDAGAWWLALAAVLALAELLVPGVFLAFIALAAAITGVVALLFPALGIAGQLVGFAAWSVLAVAIGRRWYRDYPVESEDLYLNDRVARLLGETVVICAAIEDGHGRVRVGDGEWPARGPDLPVGARVRIVGAQGTTLVVEPVAAARDTGH